MQQNPTAPATTNSQDLSNGIKKRSQVNFNETNQFLQRPVKKIENLNRNLRKSYGKDHLKNQKFEYMRILKKLRNQRSDSLSSKDPDDDSYHIKADTKSQTSQNQPKKSQKKGGVAKKEVLKEVASSNQGSQEGLDSFSLGESGLQSEASKFQSENEPEKLKKQLKEALRTDAPQPKLDPCPLEDSVNKRIKRRARNSKPKEVGGPQKKDSQKKEDVESAINEAQLMREPQRRKRPSETAGRNIAARQEPIEQIGLLPFSAKSFFENSQVVAPSKAANKAVSKAVSKVVGKVVGKVVNPTAEPAEDEFEGYDSFNDERQKYHKRYDERQQSKYGERETTRRLKREEECDAAFEEGRHRPRLCACMNKFSRVRWIIMEADDQQYSSPKRFSAEKSLEVAPECNVRGRHQRNPKKIATSKMVDRS